MDSSCNCPGAFVAPTTAGSPATPSACTPLAVTRRVTLPRAKRLKLRHAGPAAGRILFVASEVHPFSRTGGLADVAGSLPKALAAAGCDVAVATPFYNRFFPKELGHERLAAFQPDEQPLGRSWSLNRALLDNRIPVYLPEQEFLFGRDHLYGNGTGDYADNPERFAFFCRAALASLKTVGWRPDVIHCNDWQTGLLPLYLKDLAKKDRFYEGIRTVFTVHNMAFAGVCPIERLPALGLAHADWRAADYDRTLADGLEFYGDVNLLKSGLAFADRLTTVSPNYCREIQAPEHGCGLDGLLRERRDDLSGILNGIDHDLWDPTTDPALVAAFGATSPAGKELNKHALQVVENLEVSSMPLASIVSRLTDQKGLDLIAAGIEELLSLPMQLIVMGEGERKYVELLAQIEARFPDRMRVHPWFEIDEAKRVFAASDVYLMPSRFEPCGLSELIGMRYGAVPVVRRTGGLADAVREFDPARGTGNGFLFDDYSARSFVGAVRRAVTVYGDPEAWDRVRRNGMREDFSWRRSVRSYRALYHSLTAA
jgi:starch synthase